MTDNNNLIFYDTETTGIQRDFSQILQCGSVLTDKAFNSLEEQDIGCAPLPWIIPNPRAMLTNKKTNLFNSNVSHYEMILDLQRQWKQWTLDNPGIFISYNGHAFDEELVRRQFFWNLLEPYITNTNGNGRLDLMLMMHNIVCFFPEAINIPLFEDGPKISLKLEDIARANNISADSAHDAIADCNLMIDITKKIHSAVPDVFHSFLNISTKPGVMNLLNTDGFLALGEVFRRQIFRYPVVFCGSDPSRPNEIVFFDLSFDDPEEILELELSEIFKLINAGGRDGPLKKYKINKTIPICHSDLLTDRTLFDIDFDELNRRAQLVKNHEDFQTKVSQAMSDRMMSFPEPEFIEQTIYSGGFPSYKDKDLMQEFHLTDDAEHRVKIARNFEDERTRIFAERIICQMHFEQAPNDFKNRYKELFDERIASKGLWGYVESSIEETSKLLDESDDQETTNILEDTLKHLRKMQSLID
ncbi:MAG: exonuclease [SAR86 cluster bacterium]|nr:exonuclease [SAR86 cluster bacterium]